MMAVTVLDSDNLEGILADAGVELDPPASDPPSNADEKPEAKGADKGVSGDEDPDDVEGDDGLTPRQKREFTQAMQKTIGKKHRMQKEAEEFAAAQYNEKRLAEERAKLLEQELAELRAKSAPPAETPKAPEKPDRQNFASESEYIDAMIQFGVDQRLAEKAEADRKAAQEASKQEAINAAGKRINRAMELVPDFAEVTGAVDVQVPHVVAGYMQKSEMFAELAYHLAKNPDVLVSLTKLPSDEQLVKIGKIESTLQPFEAKQVSHDTKSSKEAPNGQPSKAAPSADTDIDLSKPRGKAAPVITPLDGTGSAGISKDSKDMNIREAIDDFSKRNKVNLGIRKRH